MHIASTGLRFRLVLFALCSALAAAASLPVRAQQAEEPTNDALSRLAAKLDGGEKTLEKKGGRGFPPEPASTSRFECRLANAGLFEDQPPTGAHQSEESARSL